MFATRLVAAAVLAAMLPAVVASAQGVSKGKGKMQAPVPEPGILGVWWTDKNKGRVEIVKCAPPTQGVCGAIIWISEPNDEKGRPQTDKLNRDPRLKGRPIIGMPLFEGWREVGPNAWKGKVYDPEEGEIYDIDITLRGDHLTLKGCFLFICDSNTWVRYRDQ
jgi:uncharacterized protein (DUF2147 family)